MKHNFKVGQRLKQIADISPNESPFVIVVDIKGNSIGHIHEGTTQRKTATSNCFRLVAEDNWRRRIQ